MLNLIINEYSKIFHKKSTYIMLILLLIGTIGVPFVGKLTNKLLDTTSYYGSGYDDEIKWAESSNDKTYAETLKKAKELGVDYNNLMGECNDWRAGALSEIYSTYYDGAYVDKSFSAEEKKTYEENFNTLIKSVEANDWKAYYNEMIKLIDKNPNLDTQAKLDDKYSYQYMLDHDIVPDTGAWQQEAISDYLSNKSVYDEDFKKHNNNEYVNEKEMESAYSAMLIAKYRLDNNLNAAIYESSDTEDMSSDKYIYSGDLFNSIKNEKNMLTIILIISIIVAGNIISKEFSQGTIKFLLINPVKRSKIFWSKYITVFSYALILTLITYVLGILSSIVVYGPSELNTKMLVVEGAAVAAHSAFAFTFKRFMLSFVEIFIAFTIAFMISSLFRNSTLAVALSMIIYFIGGTVCAVAAMLKLDFFRYTIFAVQDITSVVDGSSLFIHITPIFAVAVIAIHIFLLLLTAHDAFTKKNV